MHQQIPFKFEPRERYTFNTFISGANELVVNLCATTTKNDGEKQIYLWGEAELGKSHLLQAACNFSSKNNLSVCYLPSEQLVLQPPQIFDGLSGLDLICIDDVHLLVGNEEWEMALFNLINQCRQSQTSLLFSSNVTPDQLKIKLTDLQSRLLWGPVLRLQSLSDAEKLDALCERAIKKGLELPLNVAEYLMSHYPRDLFGLFERLDQLDTASMALQRRLTIPFVKEVLSNRS